MDTQVIVSRDIDSYIMSFMTLGDIRKLIKAGIGLKEYYELAARMIKRLPRAQQCYVMSRGFGLPVFGFHRVVQPPILEEFESTRLSELPWKYFNTKPKQLKLRKDITHYMDHFANVEYPNNPKRIWQGNKNDPLGGFFTGAKRITMNDEVAREIYLADLVNPPYVIHLNTALELPGKICNNVISWSVPGIITPALHFIMTTVDIFFGGWDDVWNNFTIKDSSSYVQMGYCVLAAMAFIQLAAMSSAAISDHYLLD